MLVCPSPSIPECVTRTSSITFQKYTLGATIGGSLTLKSAQSKLFFSGRRRLVDFVFRISLRKGRTSGSLLITSTSWNNGQNTFHGTVIVINQRTEDTEPVNQPLVIPERRLSPAPLEFEVKHMEEQIIRNKPVRYAVYHPGKQNSMISKDFTHTWALANYFATTDNRGEIPNNPLVEDEEQHDSEEQQGQSDCENTRNPDNSNGGKLAKEEVMPTWAATESLLLSQSSQSHGRMNTKVIAPLFRTSPTNHIRSVCQSLAWGGTLIAEDAHTVLLRHGC